MAEAREGGQSTEILPNGQFLPVALNVRDRRRDEDQVRWAIASDLVGAMNAVGRLGVPDFGSFDHQRSVLLVIHLAVPGTGVRGHALGCIHLGVVWTAGSAFLRNGDNPSRLGDSVDAPLGAL